MRGKILAVIFCVGLYGSDSLRSSVANPPKLDLECAPIQGVEAIAARRDGVILMIDGASENAADAASGIACHAAETGARIRVIGVSHDDALLEHNVQRLAAAGASIIWRAAGEYSQTISDPERAQREGAARAALYHQLVSEPADADMQIVVLGAPDAARGQLGVTGYVWAPLGALLPEERTLSLRAEASLKSGMRVRLRPFEDIPERGASMLYDGTIEMGPNIPAPSQIRGRS